MNDAPNRKCQNKSENYLCLKLSLKENAPTDDEGKFLQNREIQYNNKI